MLKIKIKIKIKIRPRKFCCFNCGICWHRKFICCCFSARGKLFILHNWLPYYNVLKQAYSSLEYKHTETTKQLLSELALLKNRVHSDITKALISKALAGENYPFYNTNTITAR